MKDKTNMTIENIEELTAIEIKNFIKELLKLKYPDADFIQIEYCKYISFDNDDQVDISLKITY